MTTVEVFDPPMCCSTGVCGSSRSWMPWVSRVYPSFSSMATRSDQGEYPSREQFRPLARLGGPIAAESRPAPVAGQPPIFDEPIAELVDHGGSIVVPKRQV